MVVLTIVIFIAMTPNNAIGTTSLPDDVHPIPVAVGPGPSVAAVPTPTPMPVPTATPAPIPTPTPAFKDQTNSVKVVPVATPLPDPTAVPEPTPLPPLPGLVPTRLRIPNLGINAPIEHVGLDDKSRMDVPHNIWNTAWYKLGAKPGERGNAVIDGHLDGPYSAAVFWNLNQLKPGNRIFVQGDNNEEKVFEVYSVETYAYEEAPMARIFGKSDEAMLNLITCGGDFDQKTQNYNKRFVAYARLVPNS